MVKIVIQTMSQVEYDQETGRQRLIKSWSNVLGKGNGKPRKPQKGGAEVHEATEADAWT